MKKISEAPKMDWESLLNAERLGTKHSSDDSRSRFERDLDRVLFSSEFRRLQNKTQIFPIPKNDYVHTRLTHSLEVASVARSLGRLAADVIIDQVGNDQIRPGDIANIVSAAALAHDIGNPPFGHSGEDAVRRYFKINESDLKKKFKISQKEFEDFNSFEGNAAGFRILTNDHPSGREGGLRLTFATIGAFMKYPKSSSDFDQNDLCKNVSERKSQKRGKFGYFQSEMEQFKVVASKCGLLSFDDNLSSSYCRHPLAFLVEAADSICYTCIDIEDGYHLGYVSFPEIMEKLWPIAKLILNNDPCNPDKELDEIKTKDEMVGYIRSRAIGNLIKESVEVFRLEYNSIMEGRFDEELTDRINDSDLFKILSEFNTKKLYNTVKGVQLELAGYEIISGLLNEYITAYGVFKEGKKDHANWNKSQKLIGLMPDHFKPELSASDYLNILRICDFITRSSDYFAIDLFKKITGERLPSIE